MKCPICKNGMTRAGFASVTLERSGVTLVFKCVPAQVCDNCGEEYIDEDITRVLLAEGEAVS
jgi:YgiT-type zinc finger domain-containing protein